MTLGPPGPHHDPPADFANACPKLPLLSRKGDWFRIHRLEHAPIYFGRHGTNRFDAPPPAPAFGVLYLARTAAGAFVETLGHDTAALAMTRLIEQAELDLRAVSKVQVRKGQALRLVDLQGSGLMRIGADARILSSDIAIAQRWAEALHDHPAEADGILYVARHDPSETCVALFERARSKIKVGKPVPLNSTGFEVSLAAILDRYDFGLA
jgi:hypothetical protein